MSGIAIVDSNTVKMRLSYKDLLLLIGILVAAIIAFTTLVYHNPSGEPHPRPLSEAERGEVSTAPTERGPSGLLLNYFKSQILKLSQ
jgi:hypothetical protein